MIKVLNYINENFKTIYVPDIDEEESENNETIITIEE